MTIKEKEFQLNKSFNNTPWIHLNDKKFNFYRVDFNDKIIGISVLIKFKNHDHLQFLYINKKFRSKGAGKNIIEKLLNKKKFTTVHVYKNLPYKVTKFYLDCGFTLSNLREKNKSLNN